MAGVSSFPLLYIPCPMKCSKYNLILLLPCYYTTIISSNNYRYHPGTSIVIDILEGHKTQYKYTGPPNGHFGPNKLYKKIHKLLQASSQKGIP